MSTSSKGFCNPPALIPDARNYCAQKILKDGIPTLERAVVVDPRNYYAQDTLKDGTPVTIRAHPHGNVDPVN